MTRNPWVVCPDCHGAGKHALHGIALTGDDLAEWSQDEVADYVAGLYDTVCETCKGRTTIRKWAVADYWEARAEARTRAMEDGRPFD